MTYDELEKLRQKAGEVMNKEDGTNTMILAAILVKLIGHINATESEVLKK